MKKFAIALAFFISIPLSGCASSAALVKIDSRPGVTQGFIHIMPKKPPVASVILYAGGSGNLRLSGPNSMVWGAGNFLVRTRYEFAKQGFQVAVIDTPEDKFGRMPLNRGGKDHVIDSQAIAAFLRTQADVPVWVVGTSRGSDSVANLAVNGGGAFDGVVFTSSVVAASFYDLEKVKIPALVVHNKIDGCFASSPKVAEDIYNKLENSKNRKLLWFSSRAQQSDACKARSPHGYLGIESRVVEAISDFIKSN